MRGLLVLSVLWSLGGCTTTTESFSCNKTAGDSCLSMDEVNAMTEESGTYVRKPVFTIRPQAKKQDHSSESLWIAGQESWGDDYA